MTPLPTAFLSVQGCKVRLDGGALQIERGEHPSLTLQLAHIGAVVALGHVEFTTAALVALAEKGIGCVLASRTGRMKAAIVAPCLRHSALRALQQELEHERALPTGVGPKALAFATSTIDSKLSALLGILTQHHRTHDNLDLSEPIARIRALRERAAHAACIDRLRGFEGAAMSVYFSAMPALCRGDLSTSSRSRRPPQDAINSALSFGYSLLVNELTSALHARGLDPALGIIHPPTDGRPSLALDLVEPLRHAIVDRLVLRAANRRELVSDDFERYADEGAGCEGVRFTTRGRGKFLELYQSAMECRCSEPGSTQQRSARSLVAEMVEGYEAALLQNPTSLSDSRQLP